MTTTAALLSALLLAAVGTIVWAMLRRAGACGRYQALHDHNPDPILRCDRHGRVLDVNPAAAALLDASSRQIAGRTVVSLLTGADIDAHRLEAMVEGTSPPMSVTVTDATDQRRRHFSCSALPATGDELYLVLRDVTSQTKAQRELEASEQRFRSLINNFTEHALVLVDTAGNITTWNHAAEQITGQPADRTIGRLARQLFITDEQVDRLLEDAARTGRAHADLALQHHDGHRRIVHCTASAITDDADEVRAFACVLTDVTADRRMQRILAESEERFRLLAEHARDGIYRLRLHPDVAYEYVNPALADITGVPAADFLDDAELPLQHVHPEDHETIRRSRSHPERLGWPQHIRWNRNGEWRHLSFTEVPLHDDDGTLVATQGFLVDITEQHARQAALEDALTQQQAAIDHLEHVDRLKDAFLQAVSHELRTPLASVIGYAQTLHGNDQRLEAGTRQQLLERLDHNAQRLGRLLEDLLDIDRLQRGIVEPNLTETDLTRLVMNVVEDLDTGEHHLEILPDGDTTATVDVSKVERIVENLVINAIRHTPSGTCVRVHIHRDHQTVNLTVEDDGPGIDDDLIDDIFEPFQQGKDSLGRSSPGTGIGLALVRQFARLHDGDAWATHRPDGGTRMHVALHDPTAPPTRSGTAAHAV